MLHARGCRVVVRCRANLHVFEQRFCIAVQHGVSRTELHHEIDSALLGVQLGIRLQKVIGLREFNVGHFYGECEIPLSAQRAELPARRQRWVAEDARRDVE